MPKPLASISSVASVGEEKGSEMLLLQPEEVASWISRIRPPPPAKV
jgi:hypothetical protein